MTALELQTTKQDIINTILEIEDPHIVERIKNYLNQIYTNEEVFPAISVTKMRAAIERSEDDIKNGRTSSNQEVMNRIHQKLATNKK
ncbi:hypothetical protein [uncultured Parabacteroides sp.]|uniref:hypothetical protein n=1 Tax=uncultured Parabacteroides sp. TaxID=512312 RepID=UPI0025F97246|nr:hypothetical protein [uncultured Parabacteroides sp.]